MGVTSYGYPYPEPTDPVAQGAAAIQALATLINSQLGVRAQGQTNITFSNALGADATITFPANRFPAGSTPRVFSNSLAGAIWQTGITTNSITNTGATIGCRHITNTAQTATVAVNWLAHL